MRDQERKLPLGKQLLYQAFALLITFIVIFPILWVVSLSLDPRDIARPTEFRLIPPGASLEAYKRVLDKPTANPVTFTQLALNQFKLAGGVALLSVIIGIFAAYSFSRFHLQRSRRADVECLGSPDLTIYRYNRPLVCYVEPDQH